MSTFNFGQLVAGKVATAVGKSDTRMKMMRAIMAACKRAGISDDDRRAIQLDIIKKASMADMTDAELGRLLDHFNRGQGGFGNRPGLHRQPHLAKAKALWWTCYWLGVIDQANDEALAAFVKRQTGIDALRFLDHRSAPAVIEALKSMASRSGVVWPIISTPVDDRLAVIAAIWARLYDAGAPVSLRIEDHSKALWPQRGPLRSQTAQELDELIRDLGKRWRRILANRARQAD